MEKLNAREISPIVDTSLPEWRITGNYQFKEYRNINDCFFEHCSNSNSQQHESLLISLLTNLFDADNLHTLQEAIIEMPQSIERLTNGINNEKANELVAKSQEIAESLLELSNTELANLPALKARRKAMGVPSNITQLAENKNDPIEFIWQFISSNYPNLEKDAFFGFSQPTEMKGSPHAYGQDNRISTPHLLLSMVGFRPDKRMNDPDKFLNAFFDAQHAGLASLCQFLISADNKFIKKASAIYSHKQLSTIALYAPYKPKSYKIQFKLND
ncbi:MAG: hypothetical protein ABJ000_04225 [Saccharospirillum sp.]|uniref:hypothetical protein n=1 Tax=Saccharospirillum sp. TaxID=2033801 RepID=UPI003296844C